MAIWPNGSRTGYYGGCLLPLGGAPYFDVPFRTRATERARWFTLPSVFTGYPCGYSGPSAAMQPRKAGAISSFRQATATMSGTGAMAMGINLIGSTTATMTGSGALTLVAWLNGAATATMTGDATLRGIAVMLGSAEAIMSSSAAMSMAANLSGSADATMTGAGALSMTVPLAGE